MKIRGFAAAGQAITPVPTAFLADEVPNAPSDYIKVYLYGLYLAGLASPPGACEMEQRLHMTSTEIENAFSYWENRGVVSVGSDGTVSYGKKIQAAELPRVEPFPYVSFNMRVGDALGRDATAYELKEIYSWLETYDFPQETAIMLITHCIERKGPRVHISYMNKVASVWAENGVDSVETAQNQIDTYHACVGGARQIMLRMGMANRQAGTTELEMYQRWTRDLGFAHEGIVRAMSGIEFSSIERPFSYLDAILTSLHEQGIHSAQEIAAQDQQQSEEMGHVKEAMRMMGENGTVTPAHVDAYRKWISDGYDHAVILLACGRASEYPNRRVQRTGAILSGWRTAGLNTEEAVRSTIAEEEMIKSDMHDVYESAGIARTVDESDIKLYRRFAKDCHMELDVLMYAAELSSVADYPARYMQSILERWSKSKVTNIAEARAECSKHQVAKERNIPARQPREVPYSQRPYKTKEEIEERKRRAIKALEERYGNT